MGSSDVPDVYYVGAESWGKGFGVDEVGVELGGGHVEGGDGFCDLCEGGMSGGLREGGGSGSYFLVYRLFGRGQM